MRPLNGIEASVARWLAEHMPEPQRQSLLRDLENAVAETTDDEQLTIRFEIGAYSRPEHHLERPLPVDTVVPDADGAKLDVTLATDKMGASWNSRSSGSKEVRLLAQTGEHYVCDDEMRL